MILPAATFTSACKAGRLTQNKTLMSGTSLTDLQFHVRILVQDRCTRPGIMVHDDPAQSLDAARLQMRRHHGEVRSSLDMVAVVQMILSLEAAAWHFDGNISDHVRSHRRLRDEGTDQFHARWWCCCPLTLQKHAACVSLSQGGNPDKKNAAAHPALHRLHTFEVCPRPLAKPLTASASISWEGIDWSADRSMSTASVAHVEHDALGMSRLCSAISCSQTPRELMHATPDDTTETLAAFPNMGGNGSLPPRHAVDP